MNAKQLQSEIVETMLRNLRILREQNGGPLDVDADDLAAMMVAIAANLAQVYAHRIADE